MTFKQFDGEIIDCVRGWFTPPPPRPPRPAATPDAAEAIARVRAELTKKSTGPITISAKRRTATTSGGNEL